MNLLYRSAIFFFLIIHLSSIVKAASHAEEIIQSGKWPKGSAMHEGAKKRIIHDNKFKKIDDLSEQISKNLIKGSQSRSHYYSGEYLAKLFNDHQKNWKSYVNSTCNLVGQSTGSGGAWPTYYAIKCKNNIADARIFQLTNSLNCIKKHIKNKVNQDIPNCLYQGYSIRF